MHSAALYGLQTVLQTQDSKQKMPQINKINVDVLGCALWTALWKLMLGICPQTQRSEIRLLSSVHRSCAVEHVAKKLQTR